MNQNMHSWGLLVCFIQKSSDVIYNVATQLSPAR